MARILIWIFQFKILQTTLKKEEQVVCLRSFVYDFTYKLLTYKLLTLESRTGTSGFDLWHKNNKITNYFKSIFKNNKVEYFIFIKKTTECFSAKVWTHCYERNWVLAKSATIYQYHKNCTGSKIQINRKLAGVTYLSRWLI